MFTTLPPEPLLYFLLYIFRLKPQLVFKCDLRVHCVKIQSKLINVYKFCKFLILTAILAGIFNVFQSKIVVCCINALTKKAYMPFSLWEDNESGVQIAERLKKKCLWKDFQPQSAQFSNSQYYFLIAWTIDSFN